MDILNFGSLNIDHVYALDHIVLAGETIASQALDTFAGGKGLNQSIALARAGAKVFHAGMVGQDGNMLVELLRDNGVDTANIRKADDRTGHAIIQLAASGQNSIVLYGGANRQLDKAFIDETLDRFGPDTMVLLQNETNLCDYIIDRAYEKGMRIALNPSPYDQQMAQCDMAKISVFILNEIEGMQIAGKSAPDEILDTLCTRYPEALVMLTLGKDGAVLRCKEGRYDHGIYDVPVADSTGAGDTFTGFFLAAVLRGQAYDAAIHLASVASSLAVMTKGAANSIPTLEQVQKANLKPLVR